MGRTLAESEAEQREQQRIDAEAVKNVQRLPPRGVIDSAALDASRKATGEHLNRCHAPWERK
jgi:hypothetical protein